MGQKKIIGQAKQQHRHQTAKWTQTSRKTEGRKQGAGKGYLCASEECSELLQLSLPAFKSLCQHLLHAGCGQVVQTASASIALSAKWKSESYTCHKVCVFVVYVC